MLHQLHEFFHPVVALGAHYEYVTVGFGLAAILVGMWELAKIVFTNIKDLSNQQ